MKNLSCCIFLSLIASSAFGSATWVETNLTEADILHEYQDKILHIATSTFSPYSNDLLTTIITTDGSFRCATALPHKAHKIAISLSEESVYCAMTKVIKKKKSKKRSRKKDR